MVNSVFLLFSLVMLLHACKDSASPLEGQRLELGVDAEVTECWITLRVDPLKSAAEYVVLRDSATIFSGKMTEPDTLLHDAGLQPNTTYTYSAYARQSSDKSKKVTTTVITMDTTSHDFSWEVYEFGADGAGSSVLYDVAIINPDDIWAVGEIYTEDTYTYDSLGNFIHPYNAAHWDGQEWELKYIYVDYRGKPNLAPLKGVFAMDDGKVIFSSGLPYLPTNNEWKLYHLWDMGILDENDGGVDNIWGTSLSNLYFAGRKGTIAHYDGQTWTKIESGTELDIRDIYGDFNPETGKYEILAIASNIAKDKEIRFLKINDKQIEELPLDGLTYFLDGIWFKANGQYFIVGSGVFENDRLYQSKSWYHYPQGLISSYYIHDVDANDINDVVTAGSFGEVLHFNGSTWKNYYSRTQFSGFYNGVDIEENLVAFVGLDSRAAYVLIGKR